MAVTSMIFAKVTLGGKSRYFEATLLLADRDFLVGLFQPSYPPKIGI